MIKVTPQNLIDWIGDRKGRYTYVDNRNCAVAQYLKAQGYEFPYVLGDELFNANDAETENEDEMTRIGDISFSLDAELSIHPNGFASLKKRLQKMVKEGIQ